MESTNRVGHPSDMNTQGGCCTTSLEKMRTSLSDKLHQYAGKLAKTADEHADCNMAQHGKQASVWLEKSADYVRNFDSKETNAKIRNSVKQHPGRALLLAGAAGLFLGMICRRR